MKERPKEIMTITLIGINILVFIVLTMIGRTEDGILCCSMEQCMNHIL